MRPRTKRINVIYYLSTKFVDRRNKWSQAIQLTMKQEKLSYMEAKDLLRKDIRWSSIKREINLNTI